MTAPTEDAPVMSRRSWYMDATVADELAAAVDAIHFATRRPKHEVLAAAVAVALKHKSDIEARLQAGSTGAEAHR